MLYLLASVPCAQAFEKYYLDDAPLYLYKTINWWYHSDPNEANFLCGKPAACRNSGNARITYDAPNHRLAITIHGGLASLFSVFKQCRSCNGPSRLVCTWRNPQYLDSDIDIKVLSTNSEITGLVLDNVNPELATHIRSASPNLLFVLEGVIGGLANGRISLHESAELLQNCGVHRESQRSRYPIMLTIVNSGTDEIIARFKMIWED